MNFIGKAGAILAAIFIVLFVSRIDSFAEGNGVPSEGAAQCLPEDSFSRYQYVNPDRIMPDVEIISAVMNWNFQCEHDVMIEVYDERGNVVKTISGSQHVGMGDNSISWNGFGADEQPVKDGIYMIKVTPLDEFAEFAVEAAVEIRLFKYPAIYGIFGEPMKDQIKQLP